MLLNAFLPQCSLDVFEQKGALWITLCTKICAQKKPAESVALSYEVLGKFWYSNLLWEVKQFALSF